MHVLGLYVRCWSFALLFRLESIWPNIKIPIKMKIVDDDDDDDDGDGAYKLFFLIHPSLLHSFLVVADQVPTD